MRRRLYFVLPDFDSARKTANDLLLARIEDRHMHFLGRRGTDLGELHEAGVAHKSDLVHGGELGAAVGGGLGLLAGVLLLLSPPGDFQPRLAVILATTLGGVLLGFWIGSLVGASVPNSRLTQFAGDMERGAILLMVDVPRQRIEEIRELVARRHPEAVARGMEPTVPAFP
jgi:hypothetical protein